MVPLLFVQVGCVTTIVGADEALLITIFAIAVVGQPAFTL